MPATELSEIEFIRTIVRAAPQTMWFLGAGASRSSGLPTATDIIWDLKRRYYCENENQDIQAHDVTSKAVQSRIQDYLDGIGFPHKWRPGEYSFYFEKTFGNDYSAQQRYLQDTLSSRQISLTVGHRMLAALLSIGRARVLFTTNFDEVVETAYAAISGRSLTAFHPEGSYAAIEALNSDQFPLYVKLHGDFRYQSVKNLSADLLRNDEQLRKCFLAAATRFGVIVSGYSGRDENVMAMFREALDQNNAFPSGILWTTPRISDVAPRVVELLEDAQRKGIKAYLVQTGTFDEMLSKIWRQMSGRPPELQQKVRGSALAPVSIAVPPPGRGYPILRTNALAIEQMPSTCGTLDFDGEVHLGPIRSKMCELEPGCTLAYTDRILFWGSRGELEKVIDGTKVRNVRQYPLDDLPASVANSGFVKALVEETIARALVHGKPLLLRKAQRTWYVVVGHSNATGSIYEPLTRALGFRDNPGKIHGKVPGLTDVFWSEAVSIRIEERNGNVWLLLRPNVWITPLRERESAADFLRERRLKRWNKHAFEILNAWITILLGVVGRRYPITVEAFPGSEYSAKFSISSLTAYSRPGTDNA
ncbi:MAG: SIR2 family protein [Proteobacteria bacterium]|nr:SIR2 family protein [Pseudomonadota bacterium]